VPFHGAQWFVEMGSVLVVDCFTLQGGSKAAAPGPAPAPSAAGDAAKPSAVPVSPRPVLTLVLCSAQPAPELPRMSVRGRSRRSSVTRHPNPPPPPSPFRPLVCGLQAHSLSDIIQDVYAGVVDAGTRDRVMFPVLWAPPSAARAAPASPDASPHETLIARSKAGIRAPAGGSGTAGPVPVRLVADFAASAIPSAVQVAAAAAGQAAVTLRPLASARFDFSGGGGAVGASGWGGGLASPGAPTGRGPLAAMSMRIA
jgi:hypothetical protein